jgi:predicted flavoprotein YhiN
MASHLQSRLGIKGVKAGLLRECLSKEQYGDEEELARAIKMLPVRLLRPRPIDEAISSAGGVRWDALQGTMLKAVPGVFVAGEMVDWEAPTGGYLLTACLAGGQAAGRDALAWLAAG